MYSSTHRLILRTDIAIYRTRTDMSALYYLLKYSRLLTRRRGKMKAPSSTILAQSLIVANSFAGVNHIPVENALEEI